MNENNPHKGHRERLRNRFIREGLESFEDHNILELLLTYSIPVRDTNETAHRLMERYQTLSGVLDADYEDLVKQDGIGEISATLIKLVQAMFRVYSMDKIAARPNFNDIDKMGDYLVAYFTGYTREATVIALLDNNMGLIACLKLFDGTVNETSLNVRRIAELGFSHKASSFILAHCHPDGNLMPSHADLTLTRMLQTTFDQLGMPLAEHFIIANNHFLPILRAVSDGITPESGKRNTFLPF